MLLILNILVSGPILCGKSMWISGLKGGPFNLRFVFTEQGDLFDSVDYNNVEVRLFETNTTRVPKDVVFHGMVKCYDTRSRLSTHHIHPSLECKTINLGLNGRNEKLRLPGYVHDASWGVDFEPLNEFM